MECIMSNGETQNLQIRMMTNEKRHNRMVTVKSETIKKSLCPLKKQSPISNGFKGN